MQALKSTPHIIWGKGATLVPDTVNKEEKNNGDEVNPLLLKPVQRY
jgi:hypothetical protein